MSNDPQEQGRSTTASAPGDEWDVHPSLLEAAQRIGSRVVDPSPPEERFVRLGGLRFHYLDWGKDGRQPLVLLHGGGQNAHTWDLFALAVRDEFHVVALDQRGHGDSDWSPDGAYGHEIQRDDLDRFVRALFPRQRIVLVAFSLGGVAAMAYAARRPAYLRALVIVDVGPESSAYARRARQFMATVQKFETIDDLVAQATRFNPRRDPERLRNSLRHNIRQLPDGYWSWKYDPAITSAPLRAGEVADKLWQGLKLINCPTLLVRGAESDVVSDTTLFRMLESIRSAESVTIEHAGHTVMGDNPLQFEHHVSRFLSRFSGEPLRFPLSSTQQEPPEAGTVEG